MIELILIILLIISLAKPDVLLSKKMKEYANESEKVILIKNLRKLYAIFIGLLETGVLLHSNQLIGGILAIIVIILTFVFALPAKKENAKIIKEINQRI